MNSPSLILTLISSMLALQMSGASLAQPQPAPYHVLRSMKIEGDGSFDWPIVDTASGKVFIPRTGSNPRISIYSLKELKLLTEVKSVSARNMALSPAAGTAFAASSPVSVLDTKTLKVVRTIPVDGAPAGISADPFSSRIFVQGRSEPGLTVLDGKSGEVVGTINVGGEIEQTASDEAGTLFVDIEDRQNVTVIDTKTLSISKVINLEGVVGKSEGMALDAAHHILFVASRDPEVVAMVDTVTGKAVAKLPIGKGCSAAAFLKRTGECFLSCADGKLVIIKENSPTEFVVEQIINTMPGTKRLSLDPGTGRIYVIGCEYEPAPPAVKGSKPAAHGPIKSGSITLLEIGLE